MSCCPLCGRAVAKFTLSFHSEFVMCSNEDCVYPFQDDNVFKTSVIDKKPPGTHVNPRRRKALPSLEGSTANGKPRLTKKPKHVDSLKTKSSASDLSKASALPQGNDIPVSTKSSTVSATSSTMTSIPPLEHSVAPQDLSTIVSNDVDAFIAALSTPTSKVSALAAQSSIPTSPLDAIPDLVFDFSPSGSWTTPVTPPDNPTHSDIKCNPAGSSLGSTPITTTTKNLESFLFDEEFDIDFGALQGINPALEFDPDFEAMLQQQL
ncbi:hypothetical protein BGZ46_005856 [Entomortierella lignicola]|nr:hypothetical protein BGZ46_005856 [Entomortierella lignicola]